MLGLGSAACNPREGSSRSPERFSSASESTAGETTSSEEPSTTAASGGGARSEDLLSLEEARQYALELINRDRKRHGLPPVEWDATATKAGQRHAEDMARHGFTAHWGTDGSVPEERYSDAGGQHFVQENAACYGGSEPRRLDPRPRFRRALIEQIERAFIDEKPPMDGHRRNILKSVHNKVGIGLAKAEGIDLPCMAQEFVDAYGQYADLPKTARVGQTIEVSGKVGGKVRFGGVGLSRIDAAKPLTPEHLRTTSSYRIPSPYVLYFPAGFKTPKPVQVNGPNFSIEVPLGEKRRPGRYGVSVWGNYPGTGNELVMISLRIIDVK